MNSNYFSEITPEILKYSKMCTAVSIIDNTLYTKYDVKRGLCLLLFRKEIRDLVACLQRDVRAEVDNSDDRFGKKIRNAAKQKVPLTLIAGDTARADGCVSFRFRDGSQLNGVKKEYAEDLIEKVCGAHEQCSTLDDFVRVSGYRA